MPIAPILMQPAYRYGAMTPWGGDHLRALYGKNIPDDRTGESLEVSAIPGLESRDEQGNTLPQLIEKYGEKLVGTKVASPFPLLLKLLDAKDTLSVQVHPDDAYAGKVENKLGKTEAWHILSAVPGAQLVYGVRENVTKEELMAASLQGAKVESLLRKVDVKAGETYFIPAGMVHAIGAGIVLYEIQQSSDVTYRFYDWERTDKDGNKRELHLEKAVAVTDVTAQLGAAAETEIAPGHYRLLDEKYFQLDRLENFSGVLGADIRRFAFITATGKTTISWEKGSIDLPQGCTAFLPADGYDLQISSQGALISYPSVQ